MVLDRVGKLAGVAKLGWWVIGWCSGGLASLLGRLQHSRRCPRSYLATFVGLTLNTSSFVHFLGAFVVRSWGQHVVRDNKVQGIATSFGPALIGLWALPVYIYIYIVLIEPTKRIPRVMDQAPWQFMILVSFISLSSENLKKT